MTELETKKVRFADASIALKIAQQRYSMAEKELIKAMQNGKPEEVSKDTE